MRLAEYDDSEGEFWINVDEDEAKELREPARIAALEACCWDEANWTVDLETAWLASRALDRIFEGLEDATGWTLIDLEWDSVDYTKKIEALRHQLRERLDAADQVGSTYLPRHECAGDDCNYQQWRRKCWRPLLPSVV